MRWLGGAVLALTLFAACAKQRNGATAQGGAEERAAEGVRQSYTGQDAVAAVVGGRRTRSLEFAP